MKLRVGSRDSRLAMIQSEQVMAAIAAAHPEIELELIPMKTTGDRILDRTLDQIGGKGLFVKELDAALLEGRVDLTVHSCKDLPAEPVLPVAAFFRREDPRDVLVLPEGVQDLRGPIGSASPRRAIQLRELFPDLPVKPVRGNVLTRLQKLDSGEYGALVLAAAGLKRLGLENRISRYFAPDELLPSAGQGILAVQCRKGMDTAFLDCLRDLEAECCALAERAFVQALDGGCSSPVAAYASVEGGTITITGLYVDDQEQLWKERVSVPLESGAAAARDLARKWKEGRTWPEK